MGELREHVGDLSLHVLAGLAELANGDGCEADGGGHHEHDQHDYGEACPEEGAKADRLLAAELPSRDCVSKDAKDCHEDCVEERLDIDLAEAEDGADCMVGDVDLVSASGSNGVGDGLLKDGSDGVARESEGVDDRNEYAGEA